VTTPTKPKLPILDDEHPVWLAILEYEATQTTKDTYAAIHKINAELVAMLKAHEAACIEYGRATMREEAAKVCDIELDGHIDTYDTTEARNHCAEVIRALPIKEQT